MKKPGAATRDPILVRPLPARHTLGTLVFLGVGALASAAQAAEFTLIDLGTFGGSSSQANAINDDGHVVGTASTVGNAATHAFLYVPASTLIDLGTLGGTNSTAWDINSLGQIVGEASVGGDTATHAFFRPAGGALRDLGTLGGTNSVAFGVNDIGQVTGRSNVGLGSRAFISAANGGALTMLGTLMVESAPPVFPDDTGRSINAAGQIAGSSLSLFTTDAFATAPNGGALTSYWVGEANAINNRGQVAGFIRQGIFSSSFFIFHATVTDIAGSGIDLGTLGGPTSVAMGINDTGQVVGTSDLAGGGTHAFLYTGSRMVDLSALSGNSGFTNARDINVFGQVVGQTAGGHAAVLTLNPRWSAVDGGNWDDAANWDFGGAGALDGMTPGRPHDVTVDPTATGVVIEGPAAETRVNSLALGGTAGGSVTLLMQNGVKLALTDGLSVAVNATLGGLGTLQGEVSNHGTLALNGSLEGTLVNTGTVRIESGQRLALSGGIVANTGVIEVAGDEATFAALSSQGRVLNGATGSILFENAVYTGERNVLAEGLANSGLLRVRGSSNHIASAIDNLADGNIKIEGKAQVTFHDEIRNNGTLEVGEAALATFLGPVSGAGAYSGSGSLDFEGRFHVGNSPAQVVMGVLTIYSENSVLAMDLAGSVGAGDCATCHAQLVFDNDVQFQGGTLEINLFDGFTPASGDEFQLFVFNAGHDGSFNQVSLPTLAAGLAWDTGALMQQGRLRVVGAVPLPGSVWLLVSVLPLVATRRRAGLRRESSGCTGAS